MSTLPDLDEASINGIVFYNLKEENGIADSDWDPMDFSSYGRIDNYTIYDNGIDGTIKSPEKIFYGDGETNGYYYPRFRVKNDGWIIVYDDTDSTYYGSSIIDSGGQTLQGEYNFYGSGFESPTNGISSWAQDYMTGLITSGGYSDPTSFSGTTYGWYDYNYENASNLTIIYAGDGLNFSYTDTITLDSLDVYGDGDNPRVEVAGSEILSPTSGAGYDRSHFTADIKNEEAVGFDFSGSTQPNSDHVLSFQSIAHWR